MNFQDIRYVGVNDHELDLFEGQYRIPNGMAYNSYIITDEKIAVVDAVDARFTEVWFENINNALNGKAPDYLIVQHMEPDHSGSIMRFMETYPGAKPVATAKAFTMIRNFFGVDLGERAVVVGDGDTLGLGRHELRFLTAANVMNVFTTSMKYKN